MIKQQATVVAMDDDTILLQAQRQTSCQKCQLKKGCGTGLLAQHVGQRFSEISVDNTTEVSIGQEVTLGIPEQALLQGTALMYLLPLLSLFGFSIAADLMGLGELVEITAGLLGLGIGLWAVKQQMKHKKDGFKASVLEE